MRLIGFATGPCWRWLESTKDAIDVARLLRIRAVELTFGDKIELLKFRLSKNRLDYLRTLDYVSLHSPFRLKRDSVDQRELMAQLDVLENLYRLCKAKALVIHPLDLPGAEILDSYSFFVSTENLPRNRRLSCTEMVSILRRYEDIGLCLDVGHAYDWDRFEIARYVKLCGERISHVHMHGSCRRQDHLSLAKASNAFLKSVEPVRLLDVPVLIEEDLDKRSVAGIRHEIRLVKKILAW
jgi:hypothetical protein